MASETNSKQRLIMIITSDENIVEQVRQNNIPSSFETIILEPGEENNIELSDLLSPVDKQSTNQEGTKKNRLICVICGSPALGRHFNVVACESCKLFFRRNALKDPTTLLCRRDNNCQITLKTRRHCLACRLAKCLRSGMKPERLIQAEEKIAARRQIKEKPIIILETDNEINEQTSHVELSTFSDHLSPSNDTNVPCPYSSKWSSQISTQSRRVFLSLEELKRIEIVQIAYEKRIELTPLDGLPSSNPTTLLEFLKSRSISAMRLLTFFRQIPEFNQLNVDDKTILIKYNLLPISLFNLALAFKIDTEQFREADTDVPLDASTLEAVIGTQIFPIVRKVFMPLVDIVQYDPTIIKLFLVALILTKSVADGDGVPEPILNDNMAVYRAQSYYTELLWKYLEAVNGFEKAFGIFITLVNRFLRWQILRKIARCNVEQTLSQTREDELVPLMKSLFHSS